METVFVKPTLPDLVIRHPKTGVQLNPEGEIVERNSYWLRRERDSDVKLSEPPKEKPAEQRKAKSDKEI